MKKSTKNTIICGAVATAITMSATFSGCSLVSTDSFKDMEQVIATVNVSSAENFDTELKYYQDAVDVTASIQKRDLITYFVNVGYSYVQNNNYTYEQVFNLLVDSLVNNAIMVQYSTMYLLNEKAKKEGDKAKVLADFTDPNKSQAEKYEWLLDKDSVNVAKYSLMSSLNSAIDSYETNSIKNADTSNGSGTRTTPGGVNSENDDYYPHGENDTLNYNVYTGFTGFTADMSGTYLNDRSELLKKHSTTAKRINAYNDFIEGLASYNLIDTEKENLRDITSLEYYKNEYVNQLEQQIINKYYEYYEDEQEKLLNDDEKYEYVKSVYDELLNLQKENYEYEEDFAAVLGDLSDTSFLLYAPSAENGGTYGYVYNILLPFSQAQSALLTQLQSDYADKDNSNEYKPEFYTERNKLLNSIVGYDQRTPWFNGTTEYAFDGKDIEGIYNANSNWLFFENNIKKSERYKNLEKYAGLYAFNGTVVPKDEKHEEYVLYPNPVTIKDLVDEFSSYINHIAGSEVLPKSAINFTGNENIKFTDENLYKQGSDKDEKEIDYSKFIYASGKVDFGENNSEYYNRTHVLNSESLQYKVLSAVNELQYAYTTDTGVLSHYLGYSVEAGDTSYIKEFEYAAHTALNSGAGSFSICAGNYGWHLLYVTYAFTSEGEGSEQFNKEDLDWANNVKVEGTFENLFYEWLKGADISDISTKRRSEIIERYTSDTTVTKHVSRYQDLLDMGK